MTQQTATSTSHVPTWTLSDRLRKAREHAGLSQQELADAIGVARNTINNYERGKDARPRTLRDWAVVCDVDALWLVTGSDEPPPEGSPARHVWQKTMGVTRLVTNGQIFRMNGSNAAPLAA